MSTKDANQAAEGTIQVIRDGAIIATLAVVLCLVAACNTTKGVGKDVESLGEGIQDAAD